MAEAAENIPTLTDIIQAGDPSMLNHFDAHQFNTTTESATQTIEDIDLEDQLQNITETSNIIENASSFENTDTDFDIPSIKLEDEEKTEIPKQVFLDKIAPDIKETSNSISSHIESEDLKEQINKAVEAILPTIETQLKEQLYKQLDI